MKNKKKYYEERTVDSQNKQVPFAVIEAYKAVRTNLIFSMANAKCKIFEISSSVPGEGKSSCAVNLAIAFSQLGHKVLLIDADLRKPSVYRKLRLKNAKGLSSVLVNFCSSEEAVSHINPNLDVLVSGPIPPNPAELLGSDKMDEIISEYKNTYDCIVIDTPPINVVSDAIIISPNTEGIMMVVQDMKTTHEQFKKAINSIKFADSKLLGVVINSSSDRSARYPTKTQIYQY